MAQFFMKMAEAVQKNTLKPGSSIPGCNSYFLCKYLKDTMLQARSVRNRVHASAMVHNPSETPDTIACIVPVLLIWWWRHGSPVLRDSRKTTCRGNAGLTVRNGQSSGTCLRTSAGE